MIAICKELLYQKQKELPWVLARSDVALDILPKGVMSLGLLLPVRIAIPVWWVRVGNQQYAFTGTRTLGYQDQKEENKTGVLIPGGYYI